MFRFQSEVIWAALLATAIGSGDAHAQPPSAQPSVFKVQMVCNDMCCDGCAQTVSAQIYTAPGIVKVEADVPNHLITITAKPSPKLTLERLWLLAEQGKGGPSKLIAGNTTYTLTRAESLQPEQRWPAGKYFVVVRALADRETATKIADQLHTVRGVESVQIDMDQRAFFIQSAANAPLSAWALLSVVEKAQAEPVAVGGVYGVMTMERPTEATRAAAAGQTQSQGAIR